MCMFSQPAMQPPELPPEPQQAKQPNASEARRSVSPRITDRLRAGMSTILTSGSGISRFAPTMAKTLLGQ